MEKRLWRSPIVLYLLRSEQAKIGEHLKALEREAERLLRITLQGLPDVRVILNSTSTRKDAGFDIIVGTDSKKAKFRFCVQAKSRVTPQTAIGIGQQVAKLPEGSIPVIFAPTISPRVAQILREARISYIDGAGNCWLHGVDQFLLIDRQGIPTERRPTKAAADPFSTKSSRIVRRLLSEPTKGWQVRKLAAEVGVSTGLVVKVKRALMEEGYAVEREKLLYLRDPVGLLEAWAEQYSGPAEQLAWYFRGDVADAERSIGQWCQQNALQYALAGFSAAWRLAPAVRYSVASIYVEDRGFGGVLLDQLANQYGGKPVDSGPTLVLWRPYDESVFAGTIAESSDQPVTSALQTFLDLTQTAGTGRGEDAVNAIFETHLKKPLQAAARLEAEQQSGSV